MPEKCLKIFGPEEFSLTEQNETAKSRRKQANPGRKKYFWRRWSIVHTTKTQQNVFFDFFDFGPCAQSKTSVRCPDRTAWKMAPLKCLKMT